MSPLPARFLDTLSRNLATYKNELFDHLQMGVRTRQGIGRSLPQGRMDGKRLGLAKVSFEVIKPPENL